MARFLGDFESKKRQILDRVGILELASEHVSLRRRGKRWLGLCPFHKEKTPSFTVTPDLALFKCFGCGKGGDIFSFVQFRENVPFVEAMRILADRAGVDLGNVAKDALGGPSRSDLAKVNAWAVQFFRANLVDPSVGARAREYLRGRQMSDSEIDRFGLGWAAEGNPSVRDAAARAGIDDSRLIAADLVRTSPEGRKYDTFRNRIMFPIRDATSRVVGFGGRTLAGDPAKYLNTRQNALFDKGRGLYGIDVARDAISQGGRAVIVEGYTDCLACHQAGFAETVATLGTALTEAQVELVRRYGDELILLFDSDEAGEAAADRAIRVALPRCVTVRLARVPEGKDPSDYLCRAGAAAFSDVLNKAIAALEFKWSQTVSRFGGSASEGARREAVLDFLRVVGEACGTGAVDVIQRGLLVNQVAHLLRMDGREVDRLMTRLQGKRLGRATGPEAAIGPKAPTPPLDGEQSAWARVLGVALNESGVLRTAGELPDVSRIADERDRRIAGIMGEVARELGEFRPADVLARVHDPADAERVAELARRGATYYGANYEETFRLALERMRDAADADEVDRSKRKLSDAAQEDGGADAREQLANIHRGIKERRHFLPRRLARQPIGGTDFDPAKETDPVPTVEQK